MQDSEMHVENMHSIGIHIQTSFNCLLLDN